MSCEQYSKITKETAENLRIIDDTMFRLVAERKEVCQEILRTLLERPQLTVVRVTPQCTILSKAVKYFKETEGDLGKMCKTVEDYAKSYAKDYAEEREKIGLEKGLEKGRSEERRNAICKMLQNGFSREMILSLDYSETELQAVEQEMFVQI